MRREGEIGEAYWSNPEHTGLRSKCGHRKLQEEQVRASAQRAPVETGVLTEVKRNKEFRPVKIKQDVVKTFKPEV